MSGLSALKRTAIHDPKHLKSVLVNQRAGHAGLSVNEHYERASNPFWRGERQHRVVTSDPSGKNPHTKVTGLPGGLTPLGRKTRNYAAGTGLVGAYGAAIYADTKKSKGKKTVDELSKAFRPMGMMKKFAPVIPGKPVAPTAPSVANGLKMATKPTPNAMPTQIRGAANHGGVLPQKARAQFGGPSSAQFGPAANRIKARQRFGGSSSTQFGVKKNMSSISVWGVDHGEEVSKDYDPKKSYRAQGMAFSAPGARRRAGRIAGREAGFYSPRATNRKANWKQVGHSMVRGAAVGAPVGAAIGGAVGRGKGALAGAYVGGELGAAGGSFHAQRKIGMRAATKAAETGIASGDIKTGLRRDQITHFGGERKNRS